MRTDMVENGTLWGKCQIIAIVRRMPKRGVTKRCVALNSASIYSSYNIILQSHRMMS